ncbi:MAG: F0F1 ATP synthase subunit A [Bacteroidetes bacterium]|jgi:F-type H+-transporting ATPase subunit a|nr:F0F1 ATP synthase subunit A [Bacteroidota bacterium]HMT35842.1 F0F1 ATP synthase subunit A [Chitinophagaceae bacterium]MBK6820444.1 F0F1 ATP synthase subunit A [Bacteroidota bacterium]MBK7041036.1 F0F1 ATP synthase subunit A [Bacteroidota bacterium]MBK7587802.1 F0F1 ATP synthase subunit A [Bacteroidota bacterium]
MRNRYQTIVKSVLLAFFGLFLYTGVAFANEHGAENKAEEGKLDIKGEIFSHIRDSYDWHFFNLGEGHDAVHVSIPLPVILINTDRGGVDVFLSSKFHHGHETYKDYQLNTQNGKIESTDNTSFYDISITKNVVSMLISLLILWFLMTGVAKKYKKNGINKAPTGFQNALEPIIGFIQDTVAKPYLGNKSMKYMPLLLSLFFFIWINNLLGLIPGGANLTGNIAVTLVLALVFFVVMLFNSNKYFWGHIFNPPGVPLAVKFILVPIEIISNLLIKPAALAIRLFANIFAGHTIILSIILLIFIFAGLSKVAGIAFIPVSIGFTIFMFFLELLVAAIQAFIFTNLTAVFISQAIEEHHHDDAHSKDAH